MLDLKVGDIIKLKKSHPCGNSEWEIVKLGVDFRLKCTKCGRFVLIPRIDIPKRMKAKVDGDNK